MKQLMVNGERKDTSAQTVRALIEEFGLSDRPVAVELNRKVIPRSDHETTPVSDGDEVELVTLVGGG